MSRAKWFYRVFRMKIFNNEELVMKNHTILCENQGRFCPFLEKKRAFKLIAEWIAAIEDGDLALEDLPLKEIFFSARTDVLVETWASKSLRTTLRDFDLEQQRNAPREPVMSRVRAICNAAICLMVSI